jgi:hypothetical protein
MTNASRSMRGALLMGAVAATLVGCDMDVANPSVIDAETFDPSTDAVVLSMSAQSNLYRAINSVVPFSALFSQEAWAGAVRQETNDIARRVMTAATSDVNTSLWTPLQRAIATNELAIQTLVTAPQAASDINLARSYMNSGFALVLLAEHFCQGTILVGPPLDSAQVLDTAINRFSQAITIGSAAATGGVTEGTKVVNASNVGLARAHLQKKEYASAATAAALVPASFVYSAIAVDDANNRNLANGVFNYDLNRLLVVPDVYRALNDPRVSWRDAGANAQDAQLRHFQQLKYAAFATATRIASGLEARYIVAEARLQTGDSTAALTLIAERRSANGQPAFTGATRTEILAELMDQRAREFWLEAKHTGDWRRNPDETPYVPDAGSPFYKPQGDFGDANCLPVPLAEIAANPNFPRP